MKSTLKLFLFILLAAMSAGVINCHADQSVPSLTQPVTDLSSVLSGSENSQLSQKIRNIRSETGSEVSVLILPSTAPETIEQYAMRVAEKWKLGRKQLSDGILIVVATEDRASRIEVGYGLEGAIPDATAKRIIEDAMIPEFKAGSYFRGLSDSIDLIERRIRGEALPPPSRPRSQASGRESPVNLIVFGAMFLLFVLPSMLGRTAGTIVGGGLTGLLVGIFVSIPLGIVAGIFVGVLIALFGASGGYSSAYPGYGWSYPSRRSSNWTLGGGGGWGGSGGSFGGGGASGKW